MNEEERAAFVERLARALAWRGLMDSERASYRLRAERILEELVDDRREAGALWQLTLTDPEADA